MVALLDSGCDALGCCPESEGIESWAASCGLELSSAHVGVWAFALFISW